MTSQSEPVANRSTLLHPMPACPTALGPARRALRDRLDDWSLPGKLVDDVVSAANELLVNAVIHGCRDHPEGSEVTLRACCTATDVRVEVHDPSVRKPRPRHASPASENGRGLELVQEFSDRWGTTIRPDGTGKSVWLEVDLPAMEDTVVVPVTLPRTRRDSACGSGEAVPGGQSGAAPCNPKIDPQGRSMCVHEPRCPDADSSDREAAVVTASCPQDGYTIRCNGVIMFEDTGGILPNGELIAPHRAMADAGAST